MRRKNFTKQFISLFTALCFMLSFAGQNLSWAAQESAPAADGFKKVFENASRIPAEYGKITSANDFASESVVVNIQDLHNHPQTQRNISRIIEILNKNYNVKEIFVEGAYGKIDTSWLAKIENQAVKDAVIEEMLEQGRLGGAEYYDIKNNKNIPLSGLEDEKRHKENLARLGYILENRPKYETVLKEIIKETGYLEAKYVNGRNKRFKRILDKYKSGKMNSGKFYSVIRKYVENIAENPEQYGNILPIKMQDYPNLQKYSLVTQLNSKTDAKRVYSQLHSLLGFLKEKLPYLAYKTLLEETENLSNAQSLSFFLSGICREYGIDLNAGYKELASFLEMQDLNRSINPVKMIYEERALTEKLRIALSSGRAESEITFLSDFYPVLSDYLTNKLLPEDFAYFSAGFPKFRELYAKYAVTDNLKKIENDFPVFDAYYSLNNQRNSIFVDNILKNRNLSAGKEKPAQGRTDEECLKESGDIIIAVTGGYHSKGLQELLQDRKITNMVITPSIMSGTEKSEDLYEKILKMQNAFAREALALTIASQAAKAEQFAALANAGVKFLENAGYSKETVDLLFKELSNAAGGDFVRAPVFGESETKIEFSNGNFITIQNDGGKLSVKESFFDEQAAKPEMKFANREIFSVSGSLAESLLADSSAFLKGDFKIVYELIKKFFQFAYDNGFNGFSFADGLTGEIEDALGTFAKGRFSIDGMDKAVIARMPDVFQNFILQQAKESGFATVYEDDSGEAVKIPLKKESKASVLPEETPDSPLKKFEEFFKQVSQEHEEREALLRDYIIALEKGKKSGYQKGALVDLKGVKKEIILVGDLHAREDNLENILKSNNNEEKIKNGEAVIVFLGDIIHSEEEDKLHETESSLKTMERIMRLKVAGPENVYVLLGNHDFIDIYTGKGNVNQGMIYRKYIEGMGPQYARLYRKAIFESALVAVGDTFAAAHAGPVRKSDLNKNPDMESFLRTEGIVESFNTRQSNENFKNSDFIFQLIWNRMGYLSGGYFQHDVDAFLNSLNVKDGALIVGHTPSVLNAGEWHAALGRKDNHHIIFAARDNAGYLSIPAGAKKPDFKFVNAFDANGGRFQIEKLEDYLSGLDPDMQKKTLALIYDIANPPEKLLYAYTMFAAAPLYYYRDLRPGDVKFFENSTPAALRLLAEKIKKDYGDYESVDINAIENAVESLISALWLQSSGSSGNAIFEAIKERIQKDEKTAISFICSANFNRSAVAELVFRHMLQKNGNKNVTVLSAGAYYEEREETQTALQEKHSKDLISKYGVDRSLIDSFKSKQFTAEHAAADFVIAAEDKHKEYVLQNFPRLAGKVFLLSEIIPDVLQSESILSVEFDPSKNFENEADLAERTFKFASYFFDGSASGAAGSGKYSAVYLDEMNDIELINALNNNEIIAIYPKREVLPEDSDGPGMYDLGLIRSSFEMYSKIISDYLFERFGTATEYFLNEMLKNAFVHGNRGDLSSPVFIDVSGDTITVYNAVKDGGDSESAERQTLFEISALAGNQAGVINMKGTVSPYGVNAADNFKLLSYSADTVEINGQPYYRASVTAANEENLKQILEKTAEDAKNMFGTVSAIQDALDEKTKELSKKYIKSAAFMESVKDSIIRTETANAAAGTDGFENALSRELYGEIVKLNLSVLFETSKTDKEKEEFIEKAADLIIPSLRNGRVISLVIDKNDADGKYTFDELSGKFKYTDKILASISKKIIPEFFERRYWEDAVPAYYEMLKNAVVHGNSAFLDRPVYIKFDADGREIKVINTEQEPDSSRMEAASYDNGGLFGMREGTNVISGAGIYKLRQQKPLSGSDIKISEASLTPKFPFISRDKGAAADLSAPLKNISGFLSRAKKLTLEDSADILLLCGNATVETFKEVLESHKKYKSADKGLKILISGGFGRLTLDVLREAVKLGIEVPVSAGETIKTEEEYNGLINAIKNDKGEIDDAKRRERVKISESKIIEMILNYLAKQDNIDISGLDIILDESARHTGENFTNPALLELIKSLNKPKVRLAYIQTPLQQLRTEMTFNGAFKDMAINNEIEGISTTVDIDYGSFGSAGELLYLTAGELLRIVIYSLAGNTIPEINGSGYMFDRIPLSAWTDIAALIERSDNSAAIKKRLKEEIVLRLIRDGKTVFPSEESLINALKPNASQEQLKAMEPFIGAVYSDMPLTADSTVYYYKNTVSGRLAVWFMRNFNKEAKAGNYSDDQIIQILLAPKKEAKLIAAIAAGAMTAEGFLSMHTKYRESSEQGKETYRTALDVIVKASKAAYEEAVSLTGNPDYAARAAAEASVAPHKMWNAKRSEMSLVSDENDSQVRRSKLRIAVGVLAMITVISFFTIFHIQIKKAEEELARLGAELEAKQAEQEELYFLTDMKMFNVLFDRQILSGYFHMPEDDEAFEKAKQDSIAATLNEENIALIKEVYERLAEAGITFDRKYTVYLIEGGEARGAFALPELEVMFLSADIIDFENFTKDEIMANLAEIIAHELDHIKRAAADPSLSDLELEYYAWKAAAEARKAIFGEQDQAAKEDEDISKAFGIIVEQMDTVEGFMDGKSKEDGIKYMREDANLYYLSIGVDRSGNNIIQIILYDRNLEKPDYLLVCNVNVEAGKFQGMMFVSYAEYLDINSILPENLDMVNKMAHKGRGAVLISAAVAFKEFAKSVLHPAKFVDMHPTQAGKTGAKILIAATYAFAAAVSVTALFIPAAAIAFLPLGILAGVFSNIVTHIIIDYHYIKASGLIGAVREFGSAATLTQEGYINLPVYVINERPENYGELGLKNTGVKLEGNTLWAGNFAGAAVVYADGVNQQAIARELASNRKINNIIKENAGKAAKKTLKNISVSFIEVDHTAAKESVDYSENGNIRVSADMVKEAAQRGNSADYSASLRRVQNIDASAFAKSVIHYLDDIKTLKEFEEYLSQHKEIGNGRIMINESLFNDIGSGIFSKFLAEAAKDGVQVYVLRSGISGTAALAAAGFAGYVSSGDGALYDFALDSSVKVKTGVFYDIPSLEEDMRNSGGIYVIENTLLKNALDSERNAMGIRDLVEILTSVKILKVFRLRPVTEESALNAARNFEIKDIPGLDGQNIEALKALISARDFSAQDFKAALGIKENAADPVSVYLMKLKTGTDNNAAIAKSFMLGIIEKALTADILRKYGKEYGLKDIGHETILGRALFAKVKYAIGDTAPDITPDSFKTVKEAEEKLNGALAELMPKAFDDKDAKSVNAIIELIPAIGEERRKLVVTDDIKPAMNIRNYGSILSAA